MCTAFVAAQYLHNIDFKGKIYLVGESGVGEELDKFGFSYTGIGVRGFFIWLLFLW